MDCLELREAELLLRFDADGENKSQAGSRPVLYRHGSLPMYPTSLGSIGAQHRLEMAL